MKAADVALLVLRLSGLFLPLAHGLGKLTSLAAGEGERLVRGVARLGLSNVDAETVKSWGNPEMALLHLAPRLAILLLGPGRLSLDHALAGRWGKRRG